MQHKLVLLRHGQSIWNVEQRFTGSTDVPLTELGVAEARRAGEVLRESGYAFDLVFTSRLSRARQTAREALMVMGLPDIEVRHDARLNERSFGILEGMRFVDAAARYGEPWGQPWLWGLRPEGGESLDDLMERLRPLWQTDIHDAVTAGRKVLVVAHGNTIRAFDELLRSGQGERLDRVPTATPLLYEWNGSPAGVKRTAFEVSNSASSASKMA
ncbi:MAG: 2,3-bisphosphoglycerate-dependent phosphoglycerate mutase [Bryobacterales bacterium]|nr:2,3-bisphosphoglycerate-dependent phosphoglycerate mutase [Bryobacterales bacterium]